MTERLLLALCLGAVWGCVWAVFLQFHRYGQWLAIKRTWITVVVGVGVDLLLALGRVGAPPSDTEIEVCAQAFAAPPDTAVVRRTKGRPGKTGACTYHVAEMTWREVK